MSDRRTPEDLAFYVRGSVEIDDSHDFAYLRPDGEDALDALVAQAELAHEMGAALREIGRHNLWNVEHRPMIDALLARLDDAS